MSRPACDHPRPLENLRSETPTAKKPDKLVGWYFKLKQIKVVTYCATSFHCFRAAQNSQLKLFVGHCNEEQLVITDAISNACAYTTPSISSMFGWFGSQGYHWSVPAVDHIVTKSLSIKDNKFDCMNHIRMNLFYELFVQLQRHVMAMN